ncbi:DUF6089 family protein [Fulvivirgaceae bacterium BMA10]|uniref:DUF6089 family protein n=1 Tax=Splendidivirga corallicola TaxID=3051826 RepID=A0ABT8KPE3_9BACT|nr:DUF6089 family protein [Fulvivirgaceae bacterium BMA10]
MMRKRLQIFVILLSVVAVFGEAFAQNNERYFKDAKKKGKINYFPKEIRYTTIGLSLNTFNYFGDLAPRPGKLSTDISFTKPGIGLIATRRVGSRYTIRASFTAGSMEGDDFESADLDNDKSRERYERNLQFKNNIQEIAITGIVDLIPNRGFFERRAPITPYVFAGIAAFHHNPRAKVPQEAELLGIPEAGEWVELQPLGTEGQHSGLYDNKPYKRIQLALPTGFGARFKLGDSFDLAFEIGYRILFFDYIDDVSTVYPDFGALETDLARVLSGRAAEPVAVVSGDARDEATLIKLNQSARTYFSTVDGRQYTVVSDNSPGARRGDPNDNDLYIVTSLQLTYVLGSSFLRPKHR